MSQTKLDSLIENLDSQQIEHQIPAIEETANIVETLAKKAVAALENSPNRFLVAERLNRFGSIIVPDLEQLLESSTNSEVKILASLVLLQLGSKAGVAILLNTIRDDEEYAILAARHLAQAGIKDAIDPICDRLKSASLEEVDLIVSLLDALNKSNGKLPQDLIQSFSSDNVSWQIKTKLEEQYSSVKF
ncbi:MAG: HEAT repeat domain-containing protein [Cyanobacteria bacterium P01_A01_bin.83]